MATKWEDFRDSKSLVHDVDKILLVKKRQCLKSYLKAAEVIGKIKLIAEGYYRLWDQLLMR